MNKIFYGVNGEGLGHASRTLSVIKHLPDHEIHVFTYGKAYDFFYNLKYPHLHLIDGLLFSYKNNKVDYYKTGLNALYYTLNIKDNINQILSLDEKIKPTLYISDLEPSIPRTAKITKKKIISIDNQHRFAYSDELKLPLSLKIYGWSVGLFAKWCVPNPNHTIISTFHYDKIKIKKKNVTLTNGLLRPEFEKIKPNNQDYILVYLRDSIKDKILNIIKKLPYEFIVFGIPPKRCGDHIHFMQSSNEFINYLANCDSVISTAGNQLLSEIRYLNKPTLLIPEPAQFEQYINGIYAESLKIAKVCKYENISEKTIQSFLDKDKYNYNQNSPVENGIPKVIQVIKNM